MTIILKLWAKRTTILLVFISILAGQASGLDFKIQTSGAEHVVAGHFSFFQVTGLLISGTDEHVTPTITGLPPGAKASWPNITNPKLCCSTFAWATAGIQPVRIDTTEATPIGTYQLTVTYSSFGGIVRTAQHALVVDPMPAPLPFAVFPPDTPLAGVAQWRANMLTYGAKHCVPTELATYEGFVWYYDGGWTYRKIFDLTQDVKWNACAKAISDFYSNYVITTSNIQGWRVFPHGLRIGFERDGTAAYKAAIMTLLNNGYANFQNLGDVLDWSLSREISYGLETSLIAEALGNPRHPNFQNLVEVLLGHFDQWFLAGNTPYIQPFMVALAAQALIQYFEVTHDPRVPDILQLAADRLWSRSFDPVSLSFLYYNNDGTTPPSPDLNLLIAPLYGWVYHQTGLERYRDRGDILFNAGVKGAYLDGGKQFAQNYRWSDRFLEWRSRPPASKCIQNPSTGVALCQVF